MDARLQQIVDEINGGVPSDSLPVFKQNPVLDLGEEVVEVGVDAGLQLQMILIDNGLLDTFDADELNDAAQAVGVSEDGLLEWWEQFASWEF